MQRYGSRVKELTIQRLIVVYILAKEMNRW